MALLHFFMYVFQFRILNECFCLQYLRPELTNALKVVSTGTQTNLITVYLTMRLCSTTILCYCFYQTHSDHLFAIVVMRLELD